MFFTCGTCKRYFKNEQTFYCWDYIDCRERYCLECKGENTWPQPTLAQSESKKTRIIGWVLTSCIVDFLGRFLPMLQATWVQVDVFLDARQTWTYYDHSNSNGTYSIWAEKFMEQSNSTDIHSISNGYFIAATVIWGLTPGFFALFAMLTQRGVQPFSVLRMIAENENCLEWLDGLIYRCNTPTQILLIILSIPIDIFCAAVVIYLLIPFASFRLAYKILMRSTFHFEEDLLGFYKSGIDSKTLPFWKGMEFCGEAIPQVVLSITFMSNNSDFMLATPTFIGLAEFYVTLISIIFSFGSILMGIYGACKSCFMIILYNSS